MAKGGDTGKVPRNIMVGETGNFDETGVPRGSPPDGAYMDNDGDTSLGGGGGYYRGIGLVEVI